LRIAGLKDLLVKNLWNKFINNLILRIYARIKLRKGICIGLS